MQVSHVVQNVHAHVGVCAAQLALRMAPAGLTVLPQMCWRLPQCSAAVLQHFLGILPLSISIYPAGSLLLVLIVGKQLHLCICMRVLAALICQPTCSLPFWFDHVLDLRTFGGEPCGIHHLDLENTTARDLCHWAMQSGSTDNALAKRISKYSRIS